VGLFVTGNVEILNSAQISMVGSRNPTPAGKRNARLFAGQLARLGITITSGLATGIDYCSHMGAIDAEAKTIAVLGSGPDVIYPERHVELAEKIAGNGALISEFTTGTPPLAGNFPRRNRIISGLSKGVLVVEATKKSGSLITAHHALEQGRDVYAIPGSVHNPLAHGCHMLIKQGAKLVESCEDIIEELNITIGKPECLMNSNGPDSCYHLDNTHKQLLEYITHDPISTDKLIEYTGFKVETILPMLLLLEIEGIITAIPGGSYARIH
jgi:DNA protecting protein DprA